MRILRSVDERPRNANQLAGALDLDYKTIRHHLDVLLDNDIVQRSGEDYGAVYLPSERVQVHWEWFSTRVPVIVWRLMLLLHVLETAGLAFLA